VLAFTVAQSLKLPEAVGEQAVVVEPVHIDVTGVVGIED
jgi:hypothetical protein